MCHLLYIEVNRAKDANEKIWTQKELLLDMVERNPSVQQFISKYKLGFA